MAKIRNIKPEFWTSEQIVKCSINARLLFIGIWGLCDDGGSCKASCTWIKTKLFSGDYCTISEIKDWIDELIDARLLIPVISDNKTTWRVAEYFWSWQRPSGGEWKKLRQRVFARDNYTCRYCNKNNSTDSKVKLHCDHVIPISKGGKNTLCNLVTACAICNNSKRDKLVEEWLA